MNLNPSRFDEILDLHKKLAIRYKEYEIANGEQPPIVVLNEMRYALRAAMKILKVVDYPVRLSKENQDYFEKACQELLHALRNAYHDLVDGILIEISRMMDELIEEYPIASKNVLGTKRLEILSDLNEIEEMVALTRGEGENRVQLYDTEIYGKWFEKIIEHYRFVDQVAIFEVLKEHERILMTESKDKRRLRRSYVFNAISITIGILGVILGLVF